MHGLLTTLGRGFKKRIGWKRLGIAASLLIIAFAITTLVRTLKGVDTGVVLIALTEISPSRIVLAALCVIGAFCTLTFYDFFALRTIGKKHVPYRIAALSSFTSYTIGHNIGATVFTGGAIRLRLERHRRRQDLFPLRTDILARQRLRARYRDGLAPVGRIRDGPAAGRDQPADRAWHYRRDRRLFRLALLGRKSPRAGTERLEGGVALGAADAAANPDRRGRSRILRDGDVSIDAGAAGHRFCFAGRGLHPGQPARIRQSCAGVDRRIRRRDAGGAA